VGAADKSVSGGGAMAAIAILLEQALSIVQNMLKHTKTEVSPSIQWMG
jgi:hypothetical protein